MNENNKTKKQNKTKKNWRALQHLNQILAYADDADTLLTPSSTTDALMNYIGEIIHFTKPERMFESEQETEVDDEKIATLRINHGKELQELTAKMHAAVERNVELKAELNKVTERYRHYVSKSNRRTRTQAKLLNNLKLIQEWQKTVLKILRSKQKNPKTSIKAAIKKAGVNDAVFYQWRNYFNGRLGKLIAAETVTKGNKIKYKNIEDEIKVVEATRRDLIKMQHGLTKKLTYLSDAKRLKPIKNDPPFQTTAKLLEAAKKPKAKGLEALFPSADLKLPKAMASPEPEKECIECRVTETPQWRKIDGYDYCNACGIRLSRLKTRQKEVAEPKARVSRDSPAFKDFLEARLTSTERKEHRTGTGRTKIERPSDSELEFIPASELLANANQIREQRRTKGFKAEPMTIGDVPVNIMEPHHGLPTTQAELQRMVMDGDFYVLDVPTVGKFRSWTPELKREAIARVKHLHEHLPATYEAACKYVGIAQSNYYGWKKELKIG
tara:strand:+ start:2036 stop:3529 length:1494 start_codon:yes stop_codon:yes gene_type:complete